MANILQLNCHKTELATGITVGKSRDTIYLLQEIHYKKRTGKPGVRVKSNFHGRNRSRAAIYLSSLTSCTFVPMHQFIDFDIAAGTIEGGSLAEPTIIASIYLDYEKPTILPKFRELVEFCKDNNLPLICGIDCNAHSPLWGSRDTNRRGEELEEFLFEYNLYVQNVGSTPTWGNKDSCSIIDITVTSRFRDRLSNWQVLAETSMSDHRLISYKVDKIQKEKVLTRNFAKADWAKFSAIIEDELDPPPTLWSNLIIESASQTLARVITLAFDKACPQHYEKKRDKIYWWNQDCQTAKTYYEYLDRKFRRARHNRDRFPTWQDVKTARKALKRAVRRAKKESFRTLVRETENAAAMAKLNKIMDGKMSHPLGFVKTPQNTITTSTQETLNVMIREHFPGSTPILEPGEDREHEDPPRPIDSCDWVNNFRIRIALRQFKPMKTAGPDEIKPVILHHLPERAITYLRCLYNACIQLGYTPTQWCHSRVVFMSKPGKDCYLSPRSFRPLSLMSFLFKTLERLVVWRVDETAFKDNPLHKRQYAFRKNLSTDNALTESINYIERSMYRGEMVIAVYLDIKGAFDNISTEAIIRSLKKRGVENLVLDWYKDYLENRTCESNLGSSKIIAKLDRGAPQGGVASPALGWNCPYDDLLQSFNNDGTEPFGFADDSKLLIAGKDFETCFSIAKHALKKAGRWARRAGVSFCPNKTAVMFFSRGNFKPNKQLHLNGVPLPWSTQTKYLGITIDHNLSFLPHIEKKLAQAKKKLMVLRHVFDQTWGPHPKVTRWSYTGIVRPAITYGSIAFASKLTSKSISDRLKRIQRLALIQIAKVRPSTPTSALEIIYDVPPLDLFIKETALKTALRLGINPTWIPQLTKGHQHVLLESLSTLSLGEATSLNPTLCPQQCMDDNRKELSWEKNYSVLIGDGKDLTYMPDWSAYTDGSRLEGRAGSGSIILRKDEEICVSSFAIGDRQVFQAEISAITDTVTSLLSNEIEYKSIFIMVDSQAALKALDKPESKADSVREAKELLNALGEKNFVTLRWIEAHKGHQRNEDADRLAKEGAKPHRPKRGPQPLPSKRKIFSLIEQQIKNEWVDRWRSLDEARQSKYFWQASAKGKTEKLLSYPRELVSRAIRFLTGHAFLRRQNAVVFHGISPPPGDISCRLCEDSHMDETPHHIITECEALVQWRINILRSDFLGEYPRWKVHNLMKFLGNKHIILLECDQ